MSGRRAGAGPGRGRSRVLARHSTGTEKGKPPPGGRDLGLGLLGSLPQQREAKQRLQKLRRRPAQPVRALRADRRRRGQFTGAVRPRPVNLPLAAPAGPRHGRPQCLAVTGGVYGVHRTVKSETRRRRADERRNGR